MTNTYNRDELETNPSLDFSEIKDTGAVLDQEQPIEEPLQDQPDPTVEKARSYGHLSKEEWEAQGKDPSKWKSPEQFVKYGEEYGEVKELIKSLRDQNKSQEAQIKMLVDYHKQSAEQTVKAARKELEIQLQQAREYGNIEAVEKLTQKKTEMDYQIQQEQVNQAAQEANRVDSAFLERNKHWYGIRPDLQQKAQELFVELKTLYPNSSYGDIVQKMEKRMYYEHPELNTSTPARPALSNQRSSVNKSVLEGSQDNLDRLYNTLSADQKAEYKTVKAMVERIPGLKYTVKEFIEKSKKGASNG